MSKSVLWTAVKLFRLPSVIAMNMFIVLPLALHTGDIGFAFWQDFPFLLLIAGEIAFNDCCDVEKDKINKPQRPLISGSLNIRLAFILSLSVIGTSLILGIYLYQANALRLILFLMTAIILSVYNLPFAGVVLVKNFLTATATVLSLSFVFTFIPISQEGFLFLVAAFLFIISRELLMDIRDIDGDSQENYRTLAVIFGENRIFCLAKILLSLSIILRILYLCSSFSLKSMVLIFIQIFIEIICYASFKKFAVPQQKNQVILLLWVPMLLMLVVLLF